MTCVFDMLGPEGFGTYRVNWVGPVFTRVSAPPQGLLIPAFIDIHIHGAYGIDFMSASSDELKVLCDKLALQGYEGLLLTTVTASADDVKQAIARIPEHPMILGFHLEGPFISQTYPGAQPPAAISSPPVAASDWDEILNHPKLKLVTLAPELPNALDLISRLMKRHVRVSIGHTNATYDEARRGFEFGADHATHIFNAMRPLHHREAGTVGYVLNNDHLYAELIYDRFHVAREAVRLLFKCKPQDHVVAVSDSTKATGLTAGTELSMWGLECVTGVNQVRLKQGGNLAGSAITLLDAFRNLSEDFGTETAIRACCLNPRLSMGWSTEPKAYLQLDKNLEIVERFELQG